MTMIANPSEEAATTRMIAACNLAQISAEPTMAKPSELVADKGHHSRTILKTLDGGVWKTRIAEPKQPGLNSAGSAFFLGLASGLVVEKSARTAGQPFNSARIGSRYSAKRLGFSANGKCPMPCIAWNRIPGILAAVASDNSTVQE